LSVPRKIDLHIRIPAGFGHAGWTKIKGKIHSRLKGVRSRWVRCNTAVFWQTEQLLGIFSTGTEKEGFPEFSIIDQNTRIGKGARNGLISHQKETVVF
jgi:hypothetical protein